MLQKTVLLCFTCLLLSVFVNCQNEKSHKIKEYYSKKCYNQTGNYSYYVRLENEFSNFAAYFESTFTMIPDRRKDFCDHERSHLNNGFHKVLTYLESCLPHQEKYLPDFLKTSFKEFLHFLCHNDGEHTRHMFSSRNRECLQKLEQGDVISELTRCFGRIFKPSSGYLTKTNMCEDLTVAEKCFHSILTDKCSSSHSYTELSKTFFRYISKPCSGCVSQINILLLILSVVLPYLFNKK